MTTLAARIRPRRRCSTERSRASVELGHEPPIEVGGSRIEGRERRGISLRWLAGVALAGLCGLALIGSALYLDLDRQSTFAEAPEFAVGDASRKREPFEGVNPGKGDRLVRPIDIVAAKQTFKAPTTIKIGDKEVVKARPFTIALDHVDDDADRVSPTPSRRSTRSRRPTARPKRPTRRPIPARCRTTPKSRFPSATSPLEDAAAATGELTLAEAQAQVVEMIKATAAGDKAPAAAARRCC